MLKPVCKVARELCEMCEPHEFDLARIVGMIKAITVVDHVFFVQYDTPPENPIWGEFTRWSKQPGAYAAFETNVEIRYATHLLDKEDWLRFVICKELCHSLEAPSGKHDVSERGVDDLVDKFSLISSAQTPPNMTRVYHLELLAEVGAIELLCPLQTRKEILEKSGRPDADACAAIAKKYNMPIGYVDGAFDPANIAAVESVINGA